jgi:hypothetical protein
LTESGIALARLVVVVASLSASQAAPVPAATCHEWHECQRLALEAYTRADYELFHDLAWRTVQTGPARNAELMYLLARAQSLSGRPHDALVMLGRLAEQGFVSDAATNDDFRAVRQLRQWPELEAVITTGARPAAPSAPTPSAPVNSPPEVSAPAVALPRRIEDALRATGVAFGAAGLAYDRVSSRFVVADVGLRKLVIIDERSGHFVDLVTSASAGFYDITGLEIDPVRGDLWVVSAEPAAPGADRSPASALHKLQLVSGRPLEQITVPVDLQPCRLHDVAVTRDGGVLVLDASGNRVLRLRSGSHTFTPVATLHVQGSTSLAAAGDRIVYVAHASGVTRLDTVTGAVEALASAPDVPLGGFERIRWVRGSLVGIQRAPDGGLRAVRVKIENGRATAMEILDGGITATDHPVATVSGDEFYLLVHQADGNANDVVIRRSLVR